MPQYIVFDKKQQMYMASRKYEEKFSADRNKAHVFHSMAGVKHSIGNHVVTIQAREYMELNQKYKAEHWGDREIKTINDRDEFYAMLHEFRKTLPDRLRKHYPSSTLVIDTDRYDVVQVSPIPTEQ